MKDNPKVLIVSEEEVIAHQLQRVLSEEGQVEGLQYQELRGEFDRLAPDLIFIVQTEDESTCIDAIDYIHQENPLVMVVFIAASQNFQLLRTVTRAGATDFFVFPDEWTLFNGKLESILHMAKERKSQYEEVASSQQTFKRGRGQVFSFTVVRVAVAGR